MVSMPLGAKLRRLRKAKGLSQEELARRSGLLRVYVARIERGEVVSPRIETRRKLAKGLAVPITELLD